MIPHPIRTVQDDAPGATVSVDQLISAQPGLLAQMSRHLTRWRISCATIFGIIFLTLRTVISKFLLVMRRL